MRADRTWMYELVRKKNGRPTIEWLNKINEFATFALGHPECVRDGNQIKCPCPKYKCKNKNYLDVATVKVHLSMNGFMVGYDVWNFHGEASISSNSSLNSPLVHETRNARHTNNLERMITDAFGPHLEFEFDDDIEVEVDENVSVEEPPNPDAKKFYELMEASKKKLFDGNHSRLSLTIELMSMKTDYQAPQALIDRVCQTYHDLWPNNNDIPKNYYNCQKIVSGLGLPVEVIHSCINHCMIYWGADKDLDCCRFCSEPRYKAVADGSKKRKASVPRKKFHYFPITPRLQRLYASSATASDMRWHSEHQMEDDKMCHPSDSKAWKHFDSTYPEFAKEVRNVRLGLCTDGFQPFGPSGRPYSLWPVILTPYNLPPGMCMKDEFFFLTCLIPGPKNPKGKIDVYLQPLIAELQQLWSEGVNTYDVSNKQNFRMRAALMWTISDFPAYAMLSGWSTAGRLACPYCMEDSDAFTLRCSRKQSWFDNHRKFLSCKHKFRNDTVSFTKGKKVLKKPPQLKSGEDILAEINRLGLQKVTEVGADLANKAIANKSGWSKKSIFWDLPYWSKLLIRHNLDVMHIEKNFFDNIFNTVLNVKQKTKDHEKSRDELNDHCARPSLAFDPSKKSYPKASYVLDKEQKDIFCEWVRNVKFPDGYASNVSRCVDMTNRKVFGMKSHDCHVFMQRLMPIAFRHLLPSAVWEAITELCLFFKELTTTSVHEANLQRMSGDIAFILCKLEKIFPPSFFDSMEHLPVHLAYEASLAGPVQYRWMYPFERYMGKLKRKVKNRNHVEGSISSGYLLEEITKFSSFYFGDDDPFFPYKLGRNDVVDETNDSDPERISVFKSSGRPIGKGTRLNVGRVDLDAAQNYILLNTPELEPYVEVYMEQVKKRYPFIDNDTMNRKLEQEFREWFKSYSTEVSISNHYIRSLAQGPLNVATSYPGFIVNGFKFHTVTHAVSRSTTNSGVSLCASPEDSMEDDYYGMVESVIELEYPAYPMKKVFVFKCSWFDTTTASRVVHPRYKIVDIKHTKRLSYEGREYEPFILAEQAGQVYYCSYPSKKKDVQSWWSVCKIKARSFLDMSDSPTTEEENRPLQDEEADGVHEQSFSPNFDDVTINLVDTSGAIISELDNADDQVDKIEEAAGIEEVEDELDTSDDEYDLN